MEMLVEGAQGSEECCGSWSFVDRDEVASERYLEKGQKALI